MKYHQILVAASVGYAVLVAAAPASILGSKTLAPEHCRPSSASDPFKLFKRCFTRGPIARSTSIELETVPRQQVPPSVPGQQLPNPGPDAPFSQQTAYLESIGIEGLNAEAAKYVCLFNTAEEARQYVASRDDIDRRAQSDVEAALGIKL